MPAIICNMTFTPYLPAKNAGADKRVKHSQERAYYNWTAPFNYRAYMEDNKKTQVHKDYSDYMSKGEILFNQYGELGRERLDAIKSELSKSKSIIWHGYISFDEENSKNFETKRQCIDYLHDTFNVLFDYSHLRKNNVELVASLHKDTDHRHIHFMFFEKQPLYKSRGEKTYSSKGKFSRFALDNFIVASNLYLDERRHELHLFRDELIGKIRKAYPVKGNVADSEISKQIKQLASELPASGRLGYESDNMKTLRGKVDVVAKQIIASDRDVMTAYRKWQSALDRREELAKSAMTESKFAYANNKRVNLNEVDVANISDWDNVAVIDKIKRDMQCRIGNHVIKMAKAVKELPRRGTARSMAKSNRRQKIDARCLREAVRGIQQMLRSLFVDTYGAKDNYIYDLHRAQREIEEDKYNAQRKA